MKIVELQAFDRPERAVACVEAPDPPAPGEGEVRFEVEAFPINPADVLLTEGRYATRPELPALVGAECVARVTDVGPGVDDLAVGDRVIHMGRDNWVQAKTVARAALVAVPGDVDPLQLAMLKVNPATALLMLTRYVELAAGDWVIQSAANSAVGGYVVRLARAMGVRTVNVVRRPDAEGALKAAGADHVLVDGPDLAERVAAAIGEKPAALGIDAVAGDTSQHLADCLRQGAPLVTYGMLSGEPCRVSPHRIVFGDVSLRGFWLVLHLQSMSADERLAMYADLAARVRAGEIAAPVEATYGIEDIRDALAHAARGGRDGKVLVTPNGPVG